MTVCPVIKPSTPWLMLYVQSTCFHVGSSAYFPEFWRTSPLRSQSDDVSRHTLVEVKAMQPGSKGSSQLVLFSGKRSQFPFVWGSTSVKMNSVITPSFQLKSGHTHVEFWVVFGPWEGGGEPRENPHRHGEKLPWFLAWESNLRLSSRGDSTNKFILAIHNPERMWENSDVTRSL